MNKRIPTSIIIFGASGDLTQRKLIPSFFNLFRKYKTPKNFNIVGYGWTPFTNEQFRTHLRHGLDEYASYSFTEKEWSLFAPHLYYNQGKYDDRAGLEKLADFLISLEEGQANRLYYMAIPPSLFPATISNLDATHQIQENGGWRRVVVEKPFGTNKESAQELNTHLHKVLNENQIYRIDHYLGKETVQNILFTRFANTIFEPLWNRNYIDSIQITVAEEVGVGHLFRHGLFCFLLDRNNN